VPPDLRGFDDYADSLMSEMGQFIIKSKYNVGGRAQKDDEDNP